MMDERPLLREATNEEIAALLERALAASRSASAWLAAVRTEAARRGMAREQKRDRDAAIRVAYAEGATQQDLGRAFNLTHQRISQIVVGVERPVLQKPSCAVCGKEIRKGSETGLCIRHKRLAGIRPKWTDAAIIEALQGFHERYGYSPTAMDLNTSMARSYGHEERIARFHRDRLPPISAITMHMGSLNAALERAGLPTRKPGHRRPPAEIRRT